MLKLRNKAFTLVELIVVIIILAILGTIAFISLQGYSKQARDSSRISDLSSIRTSLELFELDSGKYPFPTNVVDVTYSGGLVWKQGIFGESTFYNVDKLDKIPSDPLTDSNYTYSVTVKRNEYQLGGIVEGGEIAMNIPYGIEQIVNAAGNGEATAYVTGNYNGIMVKSLSGTTCRVLSVPTIITNDIEATTDLEEIITQERLVYSGKKNLPSSFKTSKFNNNGGFSFSPNKLLSYTDNDSCSVLGTSETSRIQLLKNLQISYDGTSISSDSRYKELLTTDINVSSPSYVTKMLARTLIGESLGLDIPIPTNTLPAVTELPTDLTQIFNNASSFTTNWQSNTCDPNLINVVELSPGTDVIPQNLVANTVYKLSSGDYITSYRITMADCTGIVGTTDNTVNIFSSSQIITAGNNGLIYSSLKSGNIIYGLNIDGLNDGQGLNHATNSKGVYLNFVNNFTLIKLKSFNHTYAGLETYNSNYGYIYNGYFYNSSLAGGLSIDTSNNILLKSITGYNNKYGLSIAGNSQNNQIDNFVGYDNSMYGATIATGTNNVFNNLKLYNNGNSGLALHSYNTINNIISYNNGSYGLYLTGAGGSIINNVLTYNNSSYGIYFNISQYFTVNNAISFNNFYGAYIFKSSNNFINNSAFFGNYTGLAVRGESSTYATNNLFNNINSYHNSSYGLAFTESAIDTNINNRYYGIIKMFSNVSGNIYDSTSSLSSGTSSDIIVSTMGLNNGTQDTISETFDNSWVILPSVAGWDFSLYRNQCISSGTCTNKVLTSDFNGTEIYIFGTNLMKQSQPIKYNIGISKFEYYGTSGVDYNTTSYIGEF